MKNNKPKIILIGNVQNGESKSMEIGFDYKEARNYARGLLKR